jgi:hypothetical protein
VHPARARGVAIRIRLLVDTMVRAPPLW